MKKVFYEKPTTETLVVRFEGVICGSPYNGTSSKDTENIVDDGYEGL